MAREYLESPFTPQISSELGGKSRSCQFIIPNWDSRVIPILKDLRLIGYFPIIWYISTYFLNLLKASAYLPYVVSGVVGFVAVGVYQQSDHQRTIS